MGRVQSWDNPWDVYAMSTYNTITSLSESPLQEGLVYAGTDDGIIQVTNDSGETWKKIEVESIMGIPGTAFVNDIRADLFDAGTVYAALDNHKHGDFHPYLIKSLDRGKSWTSISGNLPERTLVWRLVQDHERQDLLFLATEFGIYFTLNGGQKWMELTGGIPTIPFRDITIQRRESDLIGASFGRSFFILDDYSPLRYITDDFMEKDAVLFPVKDALLYIQKNTVDSQGASDFVAANPPFGAIFTLFLKENFLTKTKERKKKESVLEKQQADIPFPGWEALDQEKNEAKPFLVFMVKDDQGNVINRVTAPAKKGFQRVSWNLTYASGRSIGLGGSGEITTTSGYLVAPGRYSVTVSSAKGKEVHQLDKEQFFEVKPLYQGTLKGASSEERALFGKEYNAFLRDLDAVTSLLGQSMKKVKAMKQAYYQINQESPALLGKILTAESSLLELNRQLKGNQSKMEIREKQVATPGTRLAVASYGLSTTYGPTDLHKQSLDLGIQELHPIKTRLVEITQETLPSLEKALRENGAPYIEGQGILKN